MRCRRCGGAVVEMQETLPYVGPGRYVVELCDVRVARCTGCTKVTMELPEPQALDTLIRCTPRSTRSRCRHRAMRQAAFRCHNDLAMKFVASVIASAVVSADSGI
jgi:hypothetical protein